jgi:hypothetical protein
MHRRLAWHHKKWVHETKPHEHRHAVAIARTDAPHAHAAIAWAAAITGAPSSAAARAVAHATPHSGSSPICDRQRLTNTRPCLSLRHIIRQHLDSVTMEHRVGE